MKKNILIIKHGAFGDVVLAGAAMQAIRKYHMSDNIIYEGDKYTSTEKEWPFGSHVMAEQYIPGRELTVAVMGDRALGVTEIKTGHRWSSV